MDNTPTSLPQFTPVPRAMDRSNGWKPEVQRAFIEALADTGSVTSACRMVGRSTVGAYYLRRQPGADSFRAAWHAALALGVQRIEDVAMDRALNGVEVPVYSYGKLVGTRTAYNDRLLMFMLRNRAPDRFADGRARALNAIDHTRLEQERKKWRKEWELEQQAQRPRVSSAEVRASIERKVEALRKQVEEQRQREWESLSEETREAWEWFEALKARDLGRAQVAEGGSATKGPQPLLESGNRSEGPQGQLPARSVSEDIAGADAPAENKDSPKVRTIKDEGWD